MNSFFFFPFLVFTLKEKILIHPFRSLDGLGIISNDFFLQVCEGCISFPCPYGQTLVLYQIEQELGLLIAGKVK